MHTLLQTAGRLRQGDGAPSASWPAQAGHPRLAVLVSAEGVDGGPSAAMTIRTDRPSSSGAPTYLRFAVVVRLGGIYSLEAVMNGSPQYHQPVLEALCAFVRAGTI